MDLEILDGLEELGGFKVIVMDDLKEKYPERFNASGQMDYEWFEKEIRPKNFIYIRKDKNSIAFTLKGSNNDGCHAISLLYASLAMLRRSSPFGRTEALAVIDIENAILGLNSRGKL
jgi:hypothetical protein